jgi:poly-gamma-glutamate capsule biosynthesis protein CapA/YwtB (metallophosphatase superfamily)
MEHQSGTDRLQESLAAQCLQAGAAVVWGHHPHIVQRIQAADHALVAYSLGNAVFDQTAPATARQGLLLWVQIDRSGVRFAASITFSIDPRMGRTGPPDWTSLKIVSGISRN